MNLCKYKNMFGAPNTGAHKYRFLNIAIVDVLATVIVAYILSWIFKTNFFYTLITFFIIGIFAHRLFCVRTTIDKVIFPEKNEKK